MRQHTHWRWHLDEVYVKINGEMRYLWRAVDHEGEVLEALVTKTRDKAAALKFFKKALKRHGRPKAIVTDGLRSYGAALRDLGQGRPWFEMHSAVALSMPSAGLARPSLSAR
ncbi:DDE-type integrase/transposase/recombinase [Phenylobacterium sp.]|uniref:DDE-type integrase/transposase/recombinase n=1 Tax=Phenylobacterium sp. TaxID=1871053 RepID=UPI0039C95593